MKNQKVLFITETALFLALLVAVQYITSSMGQFVTGSAVNLILIASCTISGTWSGLVVALVSPFVARIFGIGPALIQIVPAIAAGNAILVLSYACIGKIKIKFEYVKWVISIAVGALLKYIVLSVSVSKVILPLTNVPGQMAAKLTAMFGVNQLITAVIGGILAMIVVPLVKRGIERK